MILCKLTARRTNHCAIASWRIKLAGLIVCCGRIAWFESTKMILSLDSILNVRLVTNWRQSGNSSWGKGKAEKWRGFFLPFFPKKKFLGLTRFDLQSTAWRLKAQHLDHYTKLSGCNRRFIRCIYTREPNSSFSPARWQRDWPLSLDNTFETDSTSTYMYIGIHVENLLGFHVDYLYMLTPIPYMSHENDFFRHIWHIYGTYRVFQY